MQFARVEKRCGPREFLTFDCVEMLCARSCFVNGQPSGLAQLILESLLKIIAKVIARRRGDLELFIFFLLPHRRLFCVYIPASLPMDIQINRFDYARFTIVRAIRY